MIIRSVKLENIRSYENEEIVFPEGSVLLSGDIGSGKSTIMLSIEFALFGIKRPYLSGSTLLRHGEKQGSVELRLSLEGKDVKEREVIIKRFLKRGKDDIRQDSGYIIIDGTKTEGTAQELKSKVLELLGYPSDLLTKQKDIIYRYTVYTPQEEMKTIIFEDKDARLETLRRVFGIDRYKRIRENCLIVIKDIKDNIRELKGKAYDIEDKKEELSEMEKELLKAKEELSKWLPKLELLGKNLKESEEKQKAYEDKIEALGRMKAEAAGLDAELRAKVERKARLNTELKAIADQAEKLKAAGKESGKDSISGLSDSELNNPGSDSGVGTGMSGREPNDSESIKRQLKDAEQELEALQKELDNINRGFHESNLMIRNSRELIAKVSGLESCPMCMQKVGDDHKKNIESRENRDIEKHSQLLKDAEDKRKQVMEKIAAKKALSEQLRKRQQEAIVAEMNRKQLAEKQAQVKRLEDEAADIKKAVGEINAKKLRLSGDIEALEPIGKEYAGLKIKHRLLLDDEKNAAIRVAETKRIKEECEKAFARLGKEIAEKESFRKKVSELLAFQEWLEVHFIGLTVVMEKHVMAQLHSEFSELFTEWFNMLIEDESLNVRLDDEFTPVIEQNGYETSIDNLSGGEKTSVALAYRLSLNKVINDFITHIRTRDIIILDEPTDGFSDQQLDRVKEVLDILKVRQVIIVSHEAKIESFVENVIRVSKEQHVSRAYD